MPKSSNNNRFRKSVKSYNSPTNTAINEDKLDISSVKNNIISIETNDGTELIAGRSRKSSVQVVKISSNENNKKEVKPEICSNVKDVNSKEYNELQKELDVNNYLI